MNTDKIQGPGQSVKFWGVIWSGKTKVTPASVIDKIQALARPGSQGITILSGVTRLLSSFHTAFGTNNTAPIVLSG